MQAGRVGQKIYDALEIRGQARQPGKGIRGPAERRVAGHSRHRMPSLHHQRRELGPDELTESPIVGLPRHRWKRCYRV